MNSMLRIQQGSGKVPIFRKSIFQWNVGKSIGKCLTCQIVISTMKEMKSKKSMEIQHEEKVILSRSREETEKKLYVGGHVKYVYLSTSVPIKISVVRFQIVQVLFPIQIDSDHPGPFEAAILNTRF